MISMYEISMGLYNFALLPIIFFSVLFVILCLANLMLGRPAPVPTRLRNYPMISVQVPVFNDPVAARCIERCMQFTYPKNRFEIIIVDDSTHVGTQEKLRSYAETNPGFVKYIHRTNRDGYKPGALRNAMPITSGEIICIFDADWIPHKGFLRTIALHFQDPKVAIVQTRQGFSNHSTNWITRFAAYILMTYHTIMMPINNRANTVFFCGTAGAIRREAMESVGGWNADSITEDTDLSVKMLLKGWKTAYVNMEHKSEVPDTFESFLKQQMRWCYGITRVFMDHSKDILFSRKLKLHQRGLIMFITLGNVAAPLVILMTIFGYAGWVLGEPALVSWNDFVNFFSKFFYTAGFLLMGVVTFAKRSMLKEVPYLFITTFTMGVILAVANSYAFTKAIFNSRLEWFCTPKVDNVKYAND